MALQNERTYLYSISKDVSRIFKWKEIDADAEHLYNENLMQKYKVYCQILLIA